jgi:hypothetical protein
MKLIPIEGVAEMYRDSDSGAIVNTSFSQLETAKKIKNKLLQSKSQMERLENRINNLEGKLDRILQHLEDK